MVSLQWWMRVVGTLYVVSFAGVLARAPIKKEGPPGVLDRAAAGDATANFVVDTWNSFGLLIGVIGAAVWYFSRVPAEAHALAWTVVAIELAWGIPIDIYKIVRGYPARVIAVWLVIHTAVVVTGVLALVAER